MNVKTMEGSEKMRHEHSSMSLAW